MTDSAGRKRSAGDGLYGGSAVFDGAADPFRSE